MAGDAGWKPCSSITCVVENARQDPWREDLWLGKQPRHTKNARLHGADGRLKMPGKRRDLVDLRLSDAAHGAETLLEFVDATFGIHKLRKSGEERMGVGRDADRNDAVLHAINDFLFIGGFGRAGNEALASGHIDEDDWIVLRMKVLFHEKFW